MPRHDIDALLAVLNAAESVLAARENQMLTSDEWDDLEHAVAAATQPLPACARDETFRIVDDALIRAVVPARGTPYEHTCERETYEAIAHAIDEMQMAGFTLEEVRQRADVPWTQGAVAIAFLKERGCIVPTVRRKHVAATEAVHIDAMIEWHELAEKRGE